MRQIGAEHHCCVRQRHLSPVIRLCSEARREIAKSGHRPPNAELQSKGKFSIHKRNQLGI